MPQPSKKDPDAHGRLHVVPVPRAWLAILTVLVIAPWLVLGGWYLWGDDERGGARAEAGIAGPTGEGAPGPWGRLLTTPIVISPPLEYVSTDWGAPGPPEWYVPQTTAEQVETWLVRAGVPADAAARIRATARPEARINGVVVRPDPALLEALPADVRGRLYGQLAATRANYAQLHPFRFEATSAEAWFGGSPIAPATRALVEPLLYRDDGFLLFADVALMRPRIAEHELRLLLKTLYRQSAILVKLSLPTADDVDDLASYWGRGGRRTDLRPLLESIAGDGDTHAIDIAHLLPSFPRNHLYRYPQVSAADFDRPTIANCLWTALNFFNTQPDDRFLEVPYALERLRKDYHVIQDGFELGDIVAFVDAEGDLFHVAVYVADDLVFTKNGTTPMAPWTIMSIASLKGYYHAVFPEPRLIYHRRNDL